MSDFVYPVVKQQEVIEDYHGTQVNDEYRWLEDPDSAETKAFVNDQNNLTVPYLESFKDRETLHKRVTEMWDYAKFSCLARRGDHYYYRHNSGLQNQSVVYVQESLHADATVFIDPNTLSEDGTIALGGQSFTEDGKLMAYMLSDSGSDWQTVKFKEAPSGVDLPDVLEKVKFSCLSWTHDSHGVFYNSYPDQSGMTDGTEVTSNVNQKLMYHRLGTKQTDDILVAEFPENPTWLHGAEVSDCGRYVILSIHDGCKKVNKLYYVDLESIDYKITGLLPFVKLVDNFDAQYEYITNEGSVFTFLTNLDAPYYRIINIDLYQPQPDKWATLVAEDERAVLEWVSCVNNNVLVLCYLEDVKNRLYLHDLKTGTRTREIPLDVGTIVGFSCRKEHTEMFYQFMSFVTPGVIYRYDFTLPDPQPELYKEIRVSGFDQTQFESHQFFYKSKDGTSMPLFVVHKKGLVKDGSNPVLLYGYGGFAISITPTFSVSRVMFMQHLGGVLAVANIRGGGEYGESWHKAGYLNNKQNVFDDFQAAAEFLIRENYTHPDKLVIHGGSNGGLLVAACANQRPDLFGCVVASVGVLDMLRFQKFTIGHAWVSDFGSSDDAEQFNALIKYSPLHNIPNSDQLTTHPYPATLLLTGDHDDRVVPLHSFKFISTLQRKLGQASLQTKPLMIRIDTKSGHGGGKPTTKIIEEVVDIYSFIALTIDLTWTN